MSGNIFGEMAKVHISISISWERRAPNSFFFLIELLINVSDMTRAGINDQYIIYMSPDPANPIIKMSLIKGLPDTYGPVFFVIRIRDIGIRTDGRLTTTYLSRHNGHKCIYHLINTSIRVFLRSTANTRTYIHGCMYIPKIHGIVYTYIHINIRTCIHT